MYDCIVEDINILECVLVSCTLNFYFDINNALLPVWKAALLGNLTFVFRNHSFEVIFFIYFNCQIFLKNFTFFVVYNITVNPDFLPSNLKCMYFCCYYVLGIFLNYGYIFLSIPAYVFIMYSSFSFTNQRLGTFPLVLQFGLTI